MHPKRITSKSVHTQTFTKKLAFGDVAIFTNPTTTTIKNNVCKQTMKSNEGGTNK